MRLSKRNLIINILLLNLMSLSFEFKLMEKFLTKKRYLNLKILIIYFQTFFNFTTETKILEASVGEQKNISVKFEHKDINAAKTAQLFGY